MNMTYFVSNTLYFVNVYVIANLHGDLFFSLFQGGLNSISPLSALKSSLNTLGNIAMPGINPPNLLERPLVPQFLPHQPDKLPGTPITGPHHMPPNLVPPPLSLAPGTLPTTSHGISAGGAPSCTSSSSASSGSASCNVTGVHPAPLPLTTATQSSEQQPSRIEAPECSPSPPPPLPPSKRLRIERKSPFDPAPDKTNHRESNGTTSSTVTTTTATIHAEDVAPTVPKVSPALHFYLLPSKPSCLQLRSIIYGQKLGQSKNLKTHKLIQNMSRVVGTCTHCYSGFS